MAIPDHKDSLLPTIRCSSCGYEIDLGSMSSHVCSSPRTNDGLLYRVEDHRRFAPPGPTQSTITPPVQMGHGNAQQIPDASRLRPRKPPALPRIDPYAPRMYSGELTPTSSGQGSQMVSPRSASSDQKSPWRAPPRKTTTPAIRRPPSPELTNLDCPFPPFPIARTRSNTPVSDTKSQSSDTEAQQARRRARSKSRSAAPSPQVSKPVSRASSIRSTKSRGRSGTTGSKDVQKNETGVSPATASNVKRRPSMSSLFRRRKSNAAEVPPLPTTVPSMPISRKGSVDEVPAAAVKAEALLVVAQLHTREIMPTFASPEFASGPPSTDSEANKRGQLPKRKGSDSTPNSAPAFDFQLELPVQGLLPTVQDSSIIEDASSFTPDALSESSSIKEPSYRAKRPERILSTESTYSVRDSMLSGPRSSTFPLTTAQGGTPSTMKMRRPSEPAPLKWDQRPSKSEGTHEMSITVSSPSDKSNYWSEAALSPTSLGRLRLDLTEGDGEDMNQQPPLLTDTIVAEPEQNVDSNRESRPRSDSASSYGSTISLVPSASSRSSPPPRDELNRRTTSGFTNPFSSEPPPPLKVRMQPDSPTDPLLQAHGHFAAMPSPPIPSLAPERHRRQTSSDIPGPLTSLTSHPLPSRSRTVGANKGICRGCTKIIDATQKSVSSADGRLTGRYHKACFVCRTCHSPFATADFYVLNDYPYCAPHYHELNGTLCSACNKGIEGQYLETTSKESRGGTKKVHPHCLKCATCHCQLSDDYFEFNGRVYCERDASRIASLPSRSQYDSAPARPSPLGQGMLSVVTDSAASKGRFPERRTTKLMMI